MGSPGSDQGPGMLDQQFLDAVVIVLDEPCRGGPAQDHSVAAGCVRAQWVMAASRSAGPVTAASGAVNTQRR